MEFRILLDYRIYITLFYFSAMATQSGSVCNDDAVIDCTKAAREGHLNDISSGGTCVKNQYVHYTHDCFVNNYDNIKVDYCCCELDLKLLCCRYHQVHNRFRCSEPEDTVAMISSSTLPLALLIATILIPILVLLCCVYCCVRCYTKWAAKKRRRKGSTGESGMAQNPLQPMAPFSSGHQLGMPETEPLKAPPSSKSFNDYQERSPMEPMLPENRPEPSAPAAPEDGILYSGFAPAYQPPGKGEDHAAPPYEEIDQNPASLQSVAPVAPAGPSSPTIAGDMPTRESQSDNPSNVTNSANTCCHGTCPACSSGAFPPPAYDESLQHPIMHH